MPLCTFEKCGTRKKVILTFEYDNDVISYVRKLCDDVTAWNGGATVSEDLNSERLLWTGKRYVKVANLPSSWYRNPVGTVKCVHTWQRATVERYEITFSCASSLYWTHLPSIKMLDAMMTEIRGSSLRELRAAYRRSNTYYIHRSPLIGKIRVNKTKTNN